MRKRLNDLDHALDEHVDPTAVIAGDAAEKETQCEADGNANEAHGERDTRAIEDARQHVTAEPVGAEKEELSVLGRADEMKIALPEAPEEIALAMAEEAQRLHDVGILAVDPLQVVHVEAVVVAMNEGSDEVAIMEEMDRLRGRKDED